MDSHTTTNGATSTLKNYRPQNTPVATKDDTLIDGRSTSWSQLAKNLGEQQTLKEKIAMLKEKRRQNRNKKK